MPQAFFAPALDLMIKVARSYDLDAESLMREYGIDPALVNDSRARLSLKPVEAFYNKVAELIPYQNFGLKAEKYWHPSQMGALGYAWMTSETLRDAFKRLVRFSKVVNEASHMILKESSKKVSLVFDFSDKVAESAFRIDAPMAILLAMARSNAGEGFHPQSVTFSYPEPKDTGPFYSLFQCPITFGARTNRFTITTAEADEPRSCSNAQLALLHDQLLIEYTATLGDDDIVDRTKAVIIAKLASGNISDAAVAETFQLTERTLQRRLREYGTTFKTLMREVRMNLADKYILDNRLSLSEISFMLGFADMSSFSHAFKRWTGQSPRDYRQSNMG